MSIVQLHCEHEYKPSVKAQGDVGFDIYCPAYTVIKTGQVLRIPTGLTVGYIAPGYWLHIVDKSGMAARGLAVKGGIVDTGYRGEIGVILHNTKAVDITIEDGQAIAQGVIMHANYPADMIEINGEDIRAGRKERGKDGGLWRVQEAANG